MKTKFPKNLNTEKNFISPIWISNHEDKIYLKKLNNISDKYIKESKKYNMADRLFFIDVTPYEKLADFSRDAFIGLSIIQPISKSYEHALPNKLFEYAVSGLPVICSNLILQSLTISSFFS